MSENSALLARSTKLGRDVQQALAAAGIEVQLAWTPATLGHRWPLPAPQYKGHAGAAAEGGPESEGHQAPGEGGPAGPTPLQDGLQTNHLGP